VGRPASLAPPAIRLVASSLVNGHADMDDMSPGHACCWRRFGQAPRPDKSDRWMLPGPDQRDDESLRAYCRRFVKTNYHPAGTARMGRDSDPMAVLDPRMRVRGIEGLRVCDLSAMPDINAGNTQAPAMMLGDRCADLVMGVL
ncbi:MAG: GMC family oxidoreductase, partial [Rhodobacteraceae bacterium]|nr:GMC family oxidoreductase [Paracoccaceae bacterium]